MIFMEEGFLNSGGYKVHHVKWGDRGPRVLLVHSMGMDGHSMDTLAESLEEEYRVLSLTILDHGDSDPPRDGISLPDHAEVMRGCYRQLGFSPSVLIGHSVGGMMGMVLAAEHPDEFKGLVLVDIAPFELTGRSPRPQPPTASGTRRRPWPGSWSATPASLPTTTRTASGTRSLRREASSGSSPGETG